jgi:hypothetical protein
MIGGCTATTRHVCGCRQQAGRRRIGVGVASRKTFIALAAGVAVALPAAASCASDHGLAAPAAGSSAAASLPVTGSPPVPPGSALATGGVLNPTVAAYPQDSGATIGVGSETPEATYDSQITVTITSRPDPTSSSTSGAATELEVAHVKIDVQDGAFALVTDDFGYLGADGNVYRPTTVAGVGKPLQSGTVKAGRSAEGDIVFRVPFGGGLVQLYDGLHPRVAWRSTT